MTLHSQRKANSTQWKKIRAAILQRDGWECYYCGQEANTVDHLIPVAKGGSDDRENLVAACSRCNFSKKDKLLEDFFQRDSTVHLYRGLLSPPNDSRSHE